MSAKSDPFTEALASIVEDVVRRVVREELASRPTQDEYLSPAHAAKFADVEETTIRAWITAGRLPRYRAGGRLIRVKRSDLEAYLAAEKAEDPRRLSPEETAAKSYARHFQKG